MPGVTHRGDDIGRWLVRQRRDWAHLNEEQQHRLGETGVKPAARTQKTSARSGPKAGAGKGSDAFTRGVAALAQYIAREGTTVVSRSHVERLPDGTEHRTGVWAANQRARRDKLDTAQLTALASLGLEWAT